MREQGKERLFKFEDGRIYFSRSTERTFFFVVSLAVMAVIGLTRLGLF